MARDIAAIARILKKVLPEGNAITAVRPLTYGHSNETYLVEGADLILRLPPSSVPLLEPYNTHDVLSQYGIMEELHGRNAGLPLPVLHSMAHATSSLGDPYFLMKRCDGEAWPDWKAPEWVMEGDDQLRSSVSAQQISLYIALHRQKPLASLGAVTSSVEELSRWWGPIKHLADDSTREAFETLLQHSPQDAAPAPVHGDARLANLLWFDGKITAMLDWEMAFNGDPRWDIASILQYLECPEHPCFPGNDAPGFWRREQVLAEWQGRAGRRADDMKWFEAAAVGRSISIMTYGLWLWQAGKSSDSRLGSWGDAIRDSGRIMLKLARGVERAR